MNKKNVQLRAAARQNLLGHYGTVIGALFLSALLIILLNIPFDNMIRQGIAFEAGLRVVTGMLGIVIVTLIAVLLSAGISRIHLQLARGQETGLKDILYPFQNRPDKYFGCGILILAVSILCQLPGSICLVPVLAETAGFSTLGSTGWAVLAAVLYVIGVIVLIRILLSWSQTVRILLDSTDIPVMDAIRLSRRMMKGNNGRLFLLCLSFAAWILFGLLSLMIGLLWILPYMTQSMTRFYLDLLPDPAEAEQVR
ncbi:MAG: DUF975 family protein [Lachnospiraceae bacterium]|nr:DUF975 family protein [Lachnospiraceae bacterium]